MAQEEITLVERLRRGDERAFRELVGRWHGALERMARSIVSDAATADEVVQETWLAVIGGLERFEERSSLKTWVFAILFRQAKSRARDDARVQVWSSVSESSLEEEVVGNPERFDAAGRWLSPPRPWAWNPEDAAARRQLLEHLERHMRDLPDMQRMMVMLRDVEGFDATEVTAMLGLTAGHQRVLLHRARTTLRDVLSAHAEAVFGQGGRR